MDNPEVDLYGELKAALGRAAQADARAYGRIERLWKAITSATYASDVHPLDQLSIVLSLLQNAGCRTVGLNMEELPNDLYLAHRPRVVYNAKKRQVHAG